MRHIDQAKLVQYFEGDTSLMCDLACMFAKEWPDARVRLEMACNENQPENMRVIAHKMKSRLAYLHAERLVDECRFIEKRAKVGDLYGIQPNVKSLVQGIESVLAELEQITAMPLRDICNA